MVSVIIPAYNIEAYIEKCIQSVQSQTYSDMEIIVVDDGSSDNTGKVLDKLVDGDPRIKVIHKVNEGVSVARNAGIEVASGKYIFFFDGDDFMEPDTIEHMVSIAEKEGTDSVVYGYHRYRDGKVYETLHPRFDKTVYEGKEIITEMVSKYVGFSYEKLNGFISRVDGAVYVENPALWRMMCSGDIIRNNGIRFIPGMKVGEDTVFTSEYLSYAKKVYVEQNCYYYLVSRSDSAIGGSKKNPNARLETKMRLLDERQKLSDRIKANTGMDISPYWKGTVVMSAVELAFLFGGKNTGMKLSKRYNGYATYVKDERVKKAVKEFPLRRGSLSLTVPFLFLKWHMYGLLFLAASVLSMIGFTYERDSMMEGNAPKEAAKDNK